MRQENVEIVRRAINAFNRHDLVAWMAEFDPDVVWHAFPDEPEPGPFRGHQAVLAMAARWMDLFPDFRAEVKEYIGAGEYVIMPARMHGQTADSDAPVTVDEVYVNKCRDGKIVEVRECRTKAEAFEAVGLSEQDAHTKGGARAVSRDEDFELVRRAWEAAKPDIRNSLSFYCEDIEVTPFGATLQGEVYRGHKGVLDWWDKEIVPSWESFEVIAEDFQRVEHRLLVFGRWKARGRSSGVELEMPATWVVEFREGKIARWQTFTDRSEAFAAVGLSEQDARAQDSS